MNIEVPKNALIEIVHNSRDFVAEGWLKDWNPAIREAAETIRKLEEEGYNVCYYPNGDPSQNLPDISKDNPIVLGGGFLVLGDDEASNGCVNLRCRAFRSAGFQNVRTDQAISIIAHYGPRK